MTAWRNDLMTTNDAEGIMTAQGNDAKYMTRRSCLLPTAWLDRTVALG